MIESVAFVSAIYGGYAGWPWHWIALIGSGAALWNFAVRAWGHPMFQRAAWKGRDHAYLLSIASSIAYLTVAGAPVFLCLGAIGRGVRWLSTPQSSDGRSVYARSRTPIPLRDAIEKHAHAGERLYVEDTTVPVLAKIPVASLILRQLSFSTCRIGDLWSAGGIT